MYYTNCLVKLWVLLFDVFMFRSVWICYHWCKFHIQKIQSIKTLPIGQWDSRCLGQWEDIFFESFRRLRRDIMLKGNSILECILIGFKKHRWVWFSLWSSARFYAISPMMHFVYDVSNIPMISTAPPPFILIKTSNLLVYH